MAKIIWGFLVGAIVSNSWWIPFLFEGMDRRQMLALPITVSMLVIMGLLTLIVDNWDK